MGEFLDVLDAFSTPLKLAWILWLAWGIGQVFWYRREHVEIVTTPLPLSRPRPRRATTLARPTAESAATVAPETPTLETAEVS